MSFGETTPPVIRHLLLCHHIDYDANTPTAPFSLHGLVSQLMAEPGDQFPLLMPELWLFLRAFGDPGEYQIWVDLVPVDAEGEPTGEETTWGPCILNIHENTYIENRGWRLSNLPFKAPGRYEVWLWCESDVIAREQFLVRT
jgi:hypothetical protein